jgi:hypothetical protein
MAKETQIQRVIDSAPALRTALQDITDEQAQSTAELAVGNLYMNEKGDIVRIREIQEHPYEDVKARYRKEYFDRMRPFVNAAGEQVFFFIRYDVKYYSEERSYSLDAQGWYTGHDGQYSEAFLGDNVRLAQSLDEYDKETLNFIETKDYSGYGLNKAGTDLAENNRGGTDEDPSQELLHVGSKEHLAAAAKGMQLQRNHIALIQRSVSREMNKRRAELDTMRHALKGVLAVFEKKLKRLYRVIRSIELYLGINEDIIQIQEGENAPLNTPITFRQQIQFMDEEIGVLLEDGDGIDFESIDLFDKWLLDSTKGRVNYTRLLPEEKGVMVCRVRRHNKEYNDPWLNKFMNLENQKTYLLIRNGTNIYRIWADINVYPRLFPSRTELQDLIDKVNKTKARDYVDEETKKDEFDKVMQMYKERVLMLQGLIDRTDILHPIPRPINLFNLEADQDLVNFVYDDSEHTLGSGRLLFKQWVESINSQITRGTRILNSAHYGRDRYYVSPKEFKRRFLRDYNDYNVPDLPEKGVYSVEHVKGHDELFGLRRKEAPDGNKVETPYKGRRGGGMTRRYLAETEERHISDTHSYHEEQYVHDETGHAVVVRRVPKLFIRYNPGGRTRAGWDDWEGSDRKNNLSFEIRRDDDFVLNYDLISLDDVEYYLDSRIDRPQYLKLLPLLREIKLRRLEEIKWEQSFVLLVKGELIKEFGTRVAAVDLDFLINQAIDWWKTKVIWKRPITKNDERALRMIKDRVRKQFENK